MNTQYEPITYVIILVIFIAVWVGIFLLCRQITLWYFKINEILNVLRDIEGHLRRGETSNEIILKKPIGVIKPRGDGKDDAETTKEG